MYILTWSQKLINEKQSNHFGFQSLSCFLLLNQMMTSASTLHSTSSCVGKQFKFSLNMNTLFLFVSFNSHLPKSVILPLFSCKQWRQIIRVLTVVFINSSSFWHLWLLIYIFFMTQPCYELLMPKQGVYVCCPVGFILIIWH